MKKKINLTIDSEDFDKFKKLKKEMRDYTDRLFFKLLLTIYEEKVK